MVVAGVVVRAHRAGCRCSSSPATIGVISPTGNEVGPFLAVEQAALSQTVPDASADRDVRLVQPRRATSRPRPGRSAPGLLSQALLDGGLAPVDAYRAIVIGYALIGLVMAVGVLAPRPGRRGAAGGRAPTTGSGGASGSVARRASCCGCRSCSRIDAFGGGFIPQSLMAYWFHVQFGVEPAVLGAIFFGANLLAAVSSLSAARIAARFGLINTMVFTHLPSNVLLILVPLMPTLPLAIAGAAAALQPQPDGRADPPVVRHGGRGARTSGPRRPA